MESMALGNLKADDTYNQMEDTGGGVLEADELDDVYTVIPTAPEDPIPDSYPTTPVHQSPTNPSRHRKGHHPASMVPTHTLNGTSSLHTSVISRSPRPSKPSRNRETGSKRRDGLPSHAFSRNYYCRFCSFNTTKSKVHLYHLVDVHGVDYKIFSCDRCDYASRWKCKVIRHRKMIHKINEPKFEPEVHDSRNQTGKRPPPALHTSHLQSPTSSSVDSGTTYRKSTNSPPLLAQKQQQQFSSNQNQSLPPFTPSTSPLLTHPINPFTYTTASERVLVAEKGSTGERGSTVSPIPNSLTQVFRMIGEENSGYLSPSKPATQLDSSVSRRKQRKPVNIHRVVPTDSAIKDEDEREDNSMDTSPNSLIGLFGRPGSSDGSSTDGILNGPSWRRRLIPTAVTMTTSSAVDNGKLVTSPSKQPLLSKSLHENNNTITGLPFANPPSPQSAAGSHGNHLSNDTINQNQEDNSMDDQFLIKENRVERISIDDEPHYRCVKCNFISKYLWKTNKHVKDSHGTDKTSSSIPELQKEDQSLKCSFSSTNQKSLHRHTTEHHPKLFQHSTLLNPPASSDLEDSQDEGMLSGEGELYTCELCGYTARNWSKMKEHMIRHSEGTPFACSYCDSKYKRPADLNRHLKIKHNTCLADIGLDGPTLKGVMTSYQSTDDAAAVGENVSLSSLKRPLNSTENSMGGESDDEGDDPKRLCIDEDDVNLQCNKCSYVAKWKSDLERHVKVHSEEKRFGCSVCYKSYKYHGDLNVHIRKAHPNVPIKSSKQISQSVSRPSSMCKTPPPNVQVLSNEVIVNMSHAAIINPLANLGPPSLPSTKPQFSPQHPRVSKLSSSNSTPQMPLLKPAPNIKSSGTLRLNGSSKETVIRLNSDGKPIKKGELDPSTMVHVPGGEFKCLNCCYETNFKSHLDAHMRLHPEKPFQCNFCSYASYWRGDTKKHIEKNHPEMLPEGINPYNLVEQKFEEAVKTSPHRHKPLPEVHNLPTKSDIKSDKAVIWTPPSGGMSEQPKVPPLQPTPATATQKSSNKVRGEDGTSQVLCPHCPYTTTSESRLNAHMATHYNLKIFKCPSCGKRANWKWDIQKHMRTDHPSCVDEVIVLSTEEAKESLDEYLKQHPEQRSKPKIGVSVDYKPDMWHKPKVSTDRRDLSSSSKATSIRPFRCSICARRSNWKCDIRKHYRQVHSDRDDATVELMTKEELIEAGEREEDVEMYYPELKGSNRNNTIRPYKCSVCGKSSKYRWDVTKHIKIIHKDVADAHVVEGEEMLETVDSAPSTPDMSIYEGELTDSPKVRSREPISPDSATRSIKSNGTKIGSFKCSVCQQTSEFMWVIRRHIRSLHPGNPDAKILDVSKKGEEGGHNDSRPYICSLCGKRSNWKWDVKKHIMSVHRGNIGSILDELMNKETVIYADGKTMEVDDGKTREKIEGVQSQLKEESASTQPAAVSSATGTTSSSSACYNSLPTMVGLNSVLAPSPGSASQSELANEDSESSRSSVKGHEVFSSSQVKFKCGYCFFACPSRHETVRHVRAEHNGKILRIQTLNKTNRDEQTTYKAAHKTSGSGSTQSMWQCSHCSYKHARKEEALMHIAQHDLFNAYQCAVCDFADDMEYTLHKHIKAKHDVENPEDVLLQNITFVPKEAETPPGITYTCNHCEMKTAWRSAIVRHIKEKHIIVGDIHSMFTKHGWNKAEPSISEPTRRYNCTLCPYRTDKVSMFNDHVNRHTQRRQSDLKCTYCDYWVSASRLLHQHMKLHQQHRDSPSFNGDVDSKDKVSSYVMTGGLAQCPHCPYQGKPKDLKAHKKLHKEREGATFKCPECPYWVNHSRLLQQHAKVHSPRYRQEGLTHARAMEDTSLEDVAAFKQHLISGQVAPIKLEHGLDSDQMQRKLHKCDKCPFASNNLLKVEEHADSHGAYTELALKCKFCDFYCESREVMAQHIKVHSLQYQGEVDDDDHLFSANGEEESEAEEVYGHGEVVESAAGFTLKYTSKRAILEKQKKGLCSRKYSCEKCPYTTAIKLNFRRHIRLHTHHQGYVMCKFCDYNAPKAKLLKAHEALHQQPHPNLLSTQSITNLTKLKPIAADVHLAHTAQLTDASQMPDGVPAVTDVHDHLNLYENAESTHSDDSDEIKDSAEEKQEPEFIDLAEFGSKVTYKSGDDEGSAPSPHSSSSLVQNDTPAVNGSVDDEDEFDMEDGEEVWICRFCDRAFDSEQELSSHERQHD